MILAESVKDTAQGLVGRTRLVGHLCNLDGAFGCGKAFVAGEEGETLCFGREKACGKLTVADTYLTVVGYGAGYAERLQAFTDVFGGPN